MDLFSKKFVGIDIADTTIEVVELKKVGRKWAVVNLGRKEISPGIVQYGRVKKAEMLAKELKEVLAKSRPEPIVAKKINFNLPDSQVYFHFFSLGPHSKDQRNELVQKEAESNIPIEASGLLYSYKVVRESKEKAEILVVAAKEKVVLEWQNFFQKLDISLSFFDIETLATFRGLFDKGVKDPICIVDIGAATTSISIFNKGGLSYSHSLNIAGNQITREISKALKIDLKEAEEKKIKIGLSRKNNRLFPVIVKRLAIITKEIKDIFKFVKDKEKQEIGQVILVGGSSRLRGLLTYFRDDLGLPAEIGRLNISNKTPLVYLTAAGAALRIADKKWSQDPVINTADIKRKDKEPAKKIEITKTDKKKDDRFEVSDKLQRQKKLLAIVIILGVVFVSTSFWFRNYEKNKMSQDIREQIEKLDQIQTTEELKEEEAVPLIFSEDKSTTTESSDILAETGDMEDEEEIISEAEPAEESEIVIIKDTETGWLNVREGPSTVYDIITQVLPGEEFELIDEDGDWINIKISEEIDGWVSGKYIEKKLLEVDSE